MKSGFYKIGKNLMNQVYEGAVFNTVLKLHDPASEEDNFNIIHDTAVRLSVIAPILRPKLASALFKEARNHARTVLLQCLASCDHTDENVLHKGVTQSHADTLKETINEDDDEDLPWLNAFTSPKKPPAASKTDQDQTTPPSASKTDQDQTTPPAASKTDQEQTTGNDEPAPNKTETAREAKVERRLRRNDSTFGKKTKTHKSKNASRLEMLEKGKTILDLLVDKGSHGITLSSVLTITLKYEASWERFPKDAESLKMLPYDKIT